MKIIAIGIFIIIIIIGILLFRMPKSKTYTNKEWDEVCKRDFKKHGPVPDDEF